MLCPHIFPRNRAHIKSFETNKQQNKFPIRSFSYSLPPRLKNNTHKNKTKMVRKKQVVLPGVRLQATVPVPE